MARAAGGIRFFYYLLTSCMLWLLRHFKVAGDNQSWQDGCVAFKHLNHFACVFVVVLAVGRDSLLISWSSCWCAGCFCVGIGPTESSIGEEAYRSPAGDVKDANSKHKCILAIMSGAHLQPRPGSIPEAVLVRLPNRPPFPGCRGTTRLLFIMGCWIQSATPYSTCSAQQFRV